jgi:prolyl-tRNA synthetase
LTKEGIEVLYDDREGIGAGEKFADADLLGIPWRLVVSEKTSVQGKVEAKRRNASTAHLLKPHELVKVLHTT